MPVKDLTAGAREQVQRADRLARTWQNGRGARLQLDRRAKEAVEKAVSSAARQHDLVILRSQRRLVTGLPIPANGLTSRLLQRLQGPALVISDPRTSARTTADLNR